MYSDALNAYIDSLDLTFEYKAILKQIASQDFTSGVNIESPEQLNRIIQDAAKNAETDLTPYYTKITGRTIEDLKNQMSDIRQNFGTFVESTTNDYKKQLANAKQSLRARGLTFSGTSRQQLGKEGALEFAGVEGEIPTDYRSKIQSEQQKQLQTSRDIGLKAERDLGIAGMAGIDTGTLASPFGDKKLYESTNNISTGDIALDRIKEIEKSKWDRIKSLKSNY